MKQKTILMAAMCVLLFGINVFAQSKTNFAGDWTLDVSKSKVNGIESGSMTVTQTDKDITFKTDLKRAPRPEGAPAGGGNGGGGMGGGRGMGGAPQAWTYTLDGKETSVEVPGPQGSTSTAKLKSEWDGAKLNLTSVRSFNTPNGEMTATTKETWESLEGGKALKVVRVSESPRGTQTSEFYYTKK